MSHLHINIRISLDDRRRSLGLDSVAPAAGAALLATSAGAYQRITKWLRTEFATFQTQSPETRELIQLSAKAAIDEFAHLGANRVMHATPAPQLFRKLGAVCADIGIDAKELNALVQAIGSAIWQQVTTHPDIKGREQQVRDALARYLRTLHELVQEARSIIPPKPKGLPHDLAPLLQHHLMQQYGMECSTIHLVLHSHPEPGTTPPPPTIPAPRGEPLRLLAIDHVVAMHPAPEPLNRYIESINVPLACTPLIQVDHLSHAYETGLLALRLVALGLASPPLPLLFQPQSPTGTRVHIPAESLKKLHRDLKPLLQQPLHSRIRLSTSLHRIIYGPRSLQPRADELKMTTVTLRAHEMRLQQILGRKLDYTPDETVNLLATLPILIRLWEAEHQQK